MCEGVLWLLLYFPGIRGIIGRMTKEDFERTTVDILWKVIPKSIIDWKRTLASRGMYRFLNGSELLYGHFDDPAVVRSGEYGFFALDQADDLLDDQMFKEMSSRLRQRLPNGELPAYHILMTSNPNGHDWIWRIFHKDSPYRWPEAEMFVPTADENRTNLPPDYYERMRATHGRDWVARFIDNSFDTFEAQIWKEWDEKLHIVEPFQIVKSWTRILALDHALGGWTAAAWCAIDNEGNHIFYRDYRESSAVVREHAQAILRASRDEGVHYWYADTSIWDTKGTRGPNKVPYTTYDEFVEEGIDFQPAEKALQAGIERVSAYLKPDPQRPFPWWHPLRGKLGAPRLYVFRTCENIKRDIPQWRWKATKSAETLPSPSRVGKDISDCVTGDTEILTEDGWCRMDALPQGIRVGTMSFAGRLEFQYPIDYITQPHTGEMVEIKARHADLTVTPNHRMLVYAQKKELSFRLARDLCPQDALPSTALPERPHYQWSRVTVGGQRIEIGDWAEFMGWYLSEGCATGTRGGKINTPGRGYQVIIAQHPGQKKDRIRALLERLPWRFNEYDKGFRTNSCKPLWEKLRPLGNSEEKRIPRELLQHLPLAAKQRLWDALVAGDGWICQGQPTYATVSRGLADDIAELLARMGKAGYIQARMPQDSVIGGRAIKALRMQFYIREAKPRHVSLCTAGSLGTQPKFRAVPFDGLVYCVTTPNGTLLLRRNGCAVYTGNSVRYAVMSRAIAGDPPDLAEMVPVPVRASLLRARQKMLKRGFAERYWKKIGAAIEAGEYGVDKQLEQAEYYDP